MDTKLEQLRNKKEALERKIQERTAALSQERRRLETRVKAIAGGWVMRERPDLFRNIGENLVREQDIKVFQKWFEVVDRIPEEESGRESIDPGVKT